jgi:predicted RNase H-like nuclease (RuvC/YqgF family)
VKLEKIPHHQLTAATQKENFLNNLTNTVFNICKTDKNFEESSGVEELDKKILSLTENLKSKASLIKKATRGEEKLKTLIQELDNHNNKLRFKLAEKLGIEIEE